MSMPRLHAALPAAVLALCTTLPAAAAPTTWLVQGTVTDVAGLPPVVAIGSLLRMELRFDTDTPVSNPGVCGNGGAGSTCRFRGDASQGFYNVTVGGLGPLNITADPGDPGGNTMVVRNDALDPDGSGNLVDGYSFSTRSGSGIGHDDTFLLLMRGTNLGLVADASALPLQPPPGLAALESARFEVCLNDTGQSICNRGLLNAQITQVSAVPEPGAWLLIAGGLLVLGLRRRAR